MMQSLLFSFGTYFAKMYEALFGTTEAGGLNIGFWFSMIVVALIVVAENLVFWLMKPKKRKDETSADDGETESAEPMEQNR